jgi:peptidyl-prolyl cis-trans isomerase C
MSEHSDSTDEDATSDGGNAWARLALSLAERGNDDVGTPTVIPTSSPVLTATGSDDATVGSATTAWGRIGDALHPAAEPEVEEEERPTSAWGQVAGALGAAAETRRTVPAGRAGTLQAPAGAAATGKTATGKTATGRATVGTAPPRKTATGTVPPRKTSPVDARAEARQERAEAKVKARQERADARAEARQERAEAKVRRRAEDDDDLVDEEDLLALDATDDVGVDDIGMDVAQGHVTRGDVTKDHASKDRVTKDRVTKDRAAKDRAARDRADRDRDEGDRVLSRVSAGVARVLSTTRLRVAAGLAVVLVVAVVVGLVVLPGGGGGLPADAAFRVQGQDTTVAQLNSQVNVLNALYGVSVPAKTAKGYAEFEQTEAKALAVSKLIDRLAASRGLSVPAKTASTALDNYIDQNYGGNQTSFATALGNAGLDRNDLLTELTHQALVQKLFTAVVGRAPTVTGAQITSYFQTHTTALATQATRAISSIVVATQAQAQTIINDVEAGQSFATLASKDSLDSSTKANGGVLGTLSKSQLDAAFGAAAFGASLNVPFGPVKDNGHWYVGLVTKITPAAAAMDNAKTQAAIKSYLQDQVELAKWDSYLRREIKAADITYAKAYQPTNPDQPPQTPLPTLTGASIAAESTTSASASGAVSAP